MILEWVKAALLEVQEYTRLCIAVARATVTRPFYFRDVIEQFDAIGLGSLTVVILTGMFTGAVLALQSGFTLDQFGARYPSARMTSRFEDLLEDDSLQAVVVATPVTTHYELARRALEVGGGYPGQQGGELVGHRLLLAADLSADPGGLAVARQFGGGDQRPVGGDLEMLEGVARHRALHDLVGHHAAADPLHHCGELRRHILHA